LAADVMAGLLPLCRHQWLAVRRWATAQPPDERTMVLVVGDVVPLLLLALAAPQLRFVFVGCAKSQHYSHDGLGGELRPWVRSPTRRPHRERGSVDSLTRVIGTLCPCRRSSRTTC
jgi:hypothetical protein